MNGVSTPNLNSSVVIGAEAMIAAGATSLDVSGVVAVGRLAGKNMESRNAVVIGYDANDDGGDYTNVASIGYNAMDVTSDNQFRLGNAAIDSFFIGDKFVLEVDQPLNLSDMMIHDGDRYVSRSIQSIADTLDKYLSGPSVADGAIAIGTGTGIDGTASNLFFDDSAIELGIGISTPSHELHVHNSSNNSPSLIFTGTGTGTTGADGFQIGMTTATDAWISNQENGKIQIRTNASPRVDIEADGDVIIGNNGTGDAFKINVGTVGEETVEIEETGVVIGSSVDVSSTSYTVTLDKVVHRASTSSNSITFNLPEASTVVGQIYMFKKVNSSNSMILHPATGDNIDGVTTDTSVTNDNYVIWIRANDSSTWDIIHAFNGTL